VLAAGAGSALTGVLTTGLDRWGVTTAAGKGLLFSTARVTSGSVTTGMLWVPPTAAEVRPRLTGVDAAAEAVLLSAFAPRAAECAPLRGAAVFADESLPGLPEAELEVLPESLPVSANATAVPPTMAAPIPSVTAPTPSHA
jgi:hypothetical protein